MRNCDAQRGCAAAKRSACGTRCDSTSCTWPQISACEGSPCHAGAVISAKKRHTFMVGSGIRATEP